MFISLSVNISTLDNKRCQPSLSSSLPLPPPPPLTLTLRVPQRWIFSAHTIHARLRFPALALLPHSDCCMHFTPWRFRVVWGWREGILVLWNPRSSNPFCIQNNGREMKIAQNMSWSGSCYRRCNTKTEIPDASTDIQGVSSDDLKFWKV